MVCAEMTESSTDGIATTRSISSSSGPSTLPAFMVPARCLGNRLLRLLQRPTFALRRRSPPGLVGNVGPQSRLEQLNRAVPASREVIFDKIQDLVPTTDAQRGLQAEAKSLAIELGRTRWLLYAQSGTSISTPLLVIVTLWLTVLYRIVRATQCDRIYNSGNKCPIGWCGYTPDPRPGSSI